MDIDSLKILLNQMKEQFHTIKEALMLNKKKERLVELENLTMQSGFWEDSSMQASVLPEMKIIKNTLEKIEFLEKEISDFSGYIELAEEMHDEESYQEAVNLSKLLSQKLEKLEIDTLLSEEYDASNAIVTIHPGAGGTESQDWALMLYRMYTRWSEKSDFEIEVLDLQDGEEAGLKSVSFLVKGMNAYGYLKGENGVHRLVRISPFDSNSRRHTSFAALEIIPEIDDTINVEIKPEEIEMDVYRASGAGGQHVNKTSSAVRLKHLPTGIVVSCQTERSQLQNRENAMKMLKAKIYKLERQNREKMMSDIKGESSDNSWGNQIRSYVFCPYTLVKDHRTNFEVGNVAGVMDGKIDDFIYEYLKYLKNTK
ncbi:MAG: peptide chain release factor 2 [Clostridia bacterium]|nr:peptide chain release factor 2 [Clostridia bacterium]